MTPTPFCTSCGAALRATAKFCQRCGTPTDGTARPAGAPGNTTPGTPAGGGMSHLLPWAVTGIALLSLLAYVVGQTYGGRTPAAPAAVQAATPRAPDISQMSPQERADRLFQRVMEYVEAGKSDSVLFFAPMAIQSQLALAPLDAHRRYDLGLLGLVSGDALLARAQSDTILAEQSDHLLGLILGMRSAGLQLDSAARGRFASRFLQVADRERAKGLSEYTDHAPDITAALREAANPGGPQTP